MHISEHVTEELPRLTGYKFIVSMIGGGGVQGPGGHFGQMLAPCLFRCTHVLSIFEELVRIYTPL